jgi:hypothetical protein
MALCDYRRPPYRCYETASATYADALGNVRWFCNEHAHQMSGNAARRQASELLGEIIDNGCLPAPLQRKAKLVKSLLMAIEQEEAK